MKALIRTALLLGLVMTTDTRAGACLGDSVSYQILPRVIGRPHSNIRTSYRMPCDTMIVEVGDTCTIHPGMMLHFGSSSRKENRIIVRGVLEVLGSDEAPVNFSGTLGEGDFGLIPGSGPWGGFHVDPVGEVHLRNARIFKSSPALVSLSSERVYFRKVLLKQSLDLIGPGGKYYPVDFTETRIDTLSFDEKSAVSQSTSKPEGKTIETKVSSAGPGPGTWTLLAGAAILGGAGLWWALSDDGETGKPTPSPGETKFPTKPTFPGVAP